MTIPSTEPTQPASIDAAIAEFIAEGNKPDETPDGEASTADDTDETTDESDETADDEQPSDESGPFKVDATKLAEAVEKKDLAALLAAMGPAAEEMLTSKAHATLRLQVKELKKAQDSAAASEAKAKDLTLKLAEAYGDPIAARKAATEGDVDTFIDMVEKWADRDWNDVMKWVAAGIKGRTERLEARSKETKKTDTQAQERKQQALAEAKMWIETSLSKGHERFLKEVPGAVDMVLAELRAGHSKGIDTPAKAMPMVLKKLKEQHEQLSRFLKVKEQPAPKSRRSPATKVDEETGNERRTRPLSLDESIAEFVKKEGLRR